VIKLSTEYVRREYNNEHKTHNDWLSTKHALLILKVINKE